MQEQCWSVSQATFTTRMPEVLELLLKKTERIPTPSSGSVPESALPLLCKPHDHQSAPSKTKRQRSIKNTLAPHGARTRSPATPHAPLSQPILGGRKRHSATVDVSQAKKTSDKDKKVQFTNCKPSTPKKLSRNPLNCCSLLPLRNPRRPTPPLSRKLQSRPVLGSAKTKKKHKLAQCRCTNTLLVLQKGRQSPLRLSTSALSATRTPRPALDSASACSTNPMETRPSSRSSARWSSRRTRRISPWRLFCSRAWRTFPLTQSCSEMIITCIDNRS